MLVVKRRGHREKFDEKKVYASCYFACRAIEMSEIASEKIANKVIKEMKKKLKGKKEIDSQEIFEIVGNELEKIDEDAAFMYKTHKDIS